MCKPCSIALSSHSHNLLSLPSLGFGQRYQICTMKGSSPWQSHKQELSLTATEDCCPLPMAQMHRAGGGGSCSNQIVGHKELEESSQRNSFAHFCFGFICECFLSPLVDGFQTEGMLGNEREKAVTHCMMCQGPVVTHGSWQDSGVHLTFAAPTGPATLTLAVPAYPQLSSTRCSFSAHTSSWRPSPTAPMTVPSKGR